MAVIHETVRRADGSSHRLADELGIHRVPLPIYAKLADPERVKRTIARLQAAQASSTPAPPPQQRPHRLRRWSFRRRDAERHG
jgi:hypothetical protein